jgi:Fe-S oxidoreductase
VFGGNWEVYHHSEILADLIKSGRLKPSGDVAGQLAFHDSCYLGRFNDVYSEPRQVLESIPGLKITEMDRHADKSFCCGAGGGRMWMEETLGHIKINEARTDQALAKKPDIIGVCCPFCTTMLEDGLKSRNMEENVKVRDIAELVAKSIVTD